MIKLLKPVMLCASVLALAACGGGSSGGSSRGASNPDAVAAGYQAYLQGGLVLPQSKQAAGAADVAVGADALAEYFPPPINPVDLSEYTKVYTCMAEKYPEFVSGSSPLIKYDHVLSDFEHCLFHLGFYTSPQLRKQQRDRMAQIPAPDQATMNALGEKYHSSICC